MRTTLSVSTTAGNATKPSKSRDNESQTYGMAADCHTACVVPTVEDTRGRRWQVLAAPGDFAIATRRWSQYRK